MAEGQAEAAIDRLRPHFDVDEDRGEIGQLVHAFGLYRGLHTTNAILGVEFIDASGQALSERPGFSLVTMRDGTFRSRSEVDLP